MREIRFRAKMKEDNSKWVDGTLLKIPAPPICIGVPEPDTYIMQFPHPRYFPDWNMPYKMVQAEVIPETIGEYTGFKDKNSKSIYEGDIVEAKFFGKKVVGLIEFCYGCFTITCSGVSDNQMFVFSDLEVIGNIHDNPELLKEE